MAFNLRNIQLGKPDALPSPEDKMDMLDKKVFTKHNYRIRLIGPFYPVFYHNVEGISATSEKRWFNQVPCLAYDAATETAKSPDCCPYCKAGIKTSQIFYVNAICLDDVDTSMMDPASRVESEKTPRDLGGTKYFVKNPTSQSFTPVKVLRLTASMIGRLQKLAELNYTKDENGHRVYKDLEDLEYGRDIVISYDPDIAAKGQMYSFGFDPEAETRFQPISKDLRKLLLLQDIEAALGYVPTFEQEETKLMRDIEKITNAQTPQYYLNKKNNAGIATAKSAQRTVSTELSDDIDIPATTETAPSIDDLDSIDF